MAFGLKEGSFTASAGSGTFALGLELPWQVQALADAADVRFGVP